MTETKENLQFLNIFHIEAAKKCLYYFSLKKSTIFLEFLLCLVSFIGFIIDYSNHNYYSILTLLFTLIIWSTLNYISFFHMLKSLYQYDSKKAYFGNLAISFAFYLHIFFFIINFIFNTKITCFDFSFLYIKNYSKYNTLNGALRNFLSLYFPNLIYLTFELYVCYICYSYTKHLMAGRNALVDGKNIDVYDDFHLKSAKKEEENDEISEDFGYRN